MFSPKATGKLDIAQIRSVRFHDESEVPPHRPDFVGAVLPNEVKPEMPKRSKGNSVPSYTLDLSERIGDARNVILLV